MRPAFADIRAKLPFSRFPRSMQIALVALLIMVAVVAGRSLMGTAAANDVVIEHEEANATSEASIVESKVIYVHVAGAVVSPGLFELSEGSRVAEAIDAAGGMTDSADVTSVNLARELVDGEQILVADMSDSQGASEGPSSSGETKQATGASKVSINNASANELMSLPGIGESTAEKIIADRKANGPFRQLEDLKRVSGIGDKKYEGLSDLITL